MSIFVALQLSILLLATSLPLSGVTAEVASAATGCNIKTLPHLKPPEEEGAINSNPGRAVRNGDELHVGFLKFHSGLSSKTTISVKKSHYAGKFKRFPIDLVIVEDHDSIGWVLVDQEHRQFFEIPEVPIPGPDQTTFVFVRPFMIADSGKLEIRERTSIGWGNPTSVPTNRACDVNWVDAKTITFRERSGYSKYEPGELQNLKKIGVEWMRVEG